MKPRSPMLDQVAGTLPQITATMATPRPTVTVANLKIQKTAVAYYDVRGVHAVVGNAAERGECFSGIARQGLLQADLVFYFVCDVDAEFLRTFADHLKRLDKPMPRTLFLMINNISGMDEAALDGVRRICTVAKQSSVSFWIGIESECKLEEKKPLIDEFCCSFNSRYRFLNGKLFYIGRPGLPLENVAGL